MEADWSVEIGPELPTIVVPWRDPETVLKFIDLRAHPEAISALPEVRQYPALGAALTLLNGPDSQVFTSKCDGWPANSEELDAVGITSEEQLGVAACGVTVYIDVVLREAVDFASFEWHESWLRRLTAEVRQLPSPAALVEFTLRWAQVEDSEGFATTMHLTAGGPDEESAVHNWETALLATTALIAGRVTPPDLSALSAKNSRD